MKALIALAPLLSLAACATSSAPAPRILPLVDYHAHLVSPAFGPLVKFPQHDAAALVRELDAAGIERAVVLSVAYSFWVESRPKPLLFAAAESGTCHTLLSDGISGISLAQPLHRGRRVLTAQQLSVDDSSSYRGAVQDGTTW